MIFREQLELVFQRPGFQRVDVSDVIIDKTSDIRLFYKNKGENIKAIDATHLATALTKEVDEFHTFDTGLLKLNGNVMGENLTICKPSGKQTVIPLDL